MTTPGHQNYPQNGLKIAQFWCRFRVKNRSKIALHFEALPGTILGAPRPPPNPKNNDFNLRVVQNRRSTFLRPWLSGVGFWSKNGAKMEPKCLQKSIKKAPKNTQKTTTKKTPKMEPKRLPGELPGTPFGDFWDQKGSTGLKLFCFWWPRGFKTCLSVPPSSPGTSPGTLPGTILDHIWTSELDFGSKKRNKNGTRRLTTSTKTQPNKKNRKLHKNIRPGTQTNQMPLSFFTFLLFLCSSGLGFAFTRSGQVGTREAYRINIFTF